MPANRDLLEALFGDDISTGEHAEGVEDAATSTEEEDDCEGDEDDEILD